METMNFPLKIEKYGQLHIDWKHCAALKKMTMNDYVKEALEEKIARDKKGE